MPSTDAAASSASCRRGPAHAHLVPRVRAPTKGKVTNMTTRKKNTIETLEAKLELLVAGLEKCFPKGDALVIGGERFTPTKLAAKVKGHIAPFKAARAAHKHLTECVQAREAKQPALDVLLEDAERFLSGYFGAESQSLKDFGFTPKKKRAKLTGEELAARTAKARATRDAHKGSKTPPPTKPSP
jgi:hypothetical protein